MRHMFVRGFAAAVIGCGLMLAGHAQAQAPRANGEVIRIQHFSGSVGNMHGLVAARKGFCEKYNFRCELVSINNALTAVQTVVGGSLDVAQGGTEMTAAAINAGSDLVIAGISLPGAVLFLAARSDVPLPNRAKGYPAVIADLKGMKIGVPARGAAAEVIMNVMLAEAGMKPTDVTYVAVGGPQTAYTSMVVGRQIEAAVTFSPGRELCAASKACAPIVDLPAGEGPALFRMDSAAGVVFVMRRQFVDANPNLMMAFYAAMKDAADWFRDPANLDELIGFYRQTINFADIPNGDQVLRDWITNSVPRYSRDLAVNRDGIKAAIDFAVQNKMLDQPVAIDRLVWGKAP